MLKSENTANLFDALCKFQKDMPALSMDAEVNVKTQGGGSYNFKYATLGNAIETARPILAKNGLAVSQMLNERGVITLLTHSSGEYMGSETVWNFNPTDPQKMGALITYQRRYAFCSILNIVADEDDDANTTSGNTFEKAHKELGGTVIEGPSKKITTTRSPGGPDVPCPICQSPMVEREAKKGDNKGKFWGCSKYPDCKGTRDYNWTQEFEKDAEDRINIKSAADDNGEEIPTEDLPF